MSTSITDSSNDEALPTLATWSPLTAGTFVDIRYCSSGLEVTSFTVEGSDSAGSPIHIQMLPWVLAVAFTFSAPTTAALDQGLTPYLTMRHRVVGLMSLFCGSALAPADDSLILLINVRTLRR